jgi:hypothetical protein
VLYISPDILPVSSDSSNRCVACYYRQY